MLGCICGETIPSTSGVVALGKLSDDFAVNVFVDELNDDFWLDPSLVQFIDHGAGAVITVRGSPVQIVRQTDGTWADIVPIRRPWWRFW